MRIYLSGQRTFANRGCEAIVRSTVALLRQHYSNPQVLVPSDDIARDAGQWPQAADLNVRFVPAYYPAHTRYWAHIQRLPLALLKRAGWPFPMPRSLKRTLAGVDGVLAVGGDNYSLDYRLPALTMAVDSLALALRRPVVLWGGSVGPFEAEPDFVPCVREHLARMSLITARESVSERYLRETLGLDNVTRVCDPAFTLAPEPVDVGPFWPRPAPGGVLGLNVSPLLERYRRGEDLLDQVAAFIERALDEYQLSVLLIPHVVPLDGGSRNNDARYMQGLIERLPARAGRVSLIESRLNAAQIKYVIGQCRYFIGARTHATIAALSSGVPTVSISYSVKAQGINQDIFGHTDYVLSAPAASAGTMEEKLRCLLSEEDSIRHTLKEGGRQIQQRSASAAEQLHKILA